MWYFIYFSAGIEPASPLAGYVYSNAPALRETPTCIRCPFITAGALERYAQDYHDIPFLRASVALQSFRLSLERLVATINVASGRKASAIQ